MGLNLSFFQLGFLIVFLEAVLFHFAFFYSVRKSDFSKIDLVWSLSAMLMALVVICNGHNVHFKSLLAFGLVLVWGVRLFYYLKKRNAITGEDHRYAAWRKEWGEKANLNAYIRVFNLQWVLSLIIFSPVFINLFFMPSEWILTDYLAIVIFITGFVIETIADQQKFVFKQEHPKKFIQTGLWKYSRHPNYFGEALVWWGFFIFSFSAGTTFYSFWGVSLLTFFLIKVSGVAMLEKSRAKDSEYQEYRKRVSAFIPWFPKKNV
jgi:steroid 5-alpha reductase family enzyme